MTATRLLTFSILALFLGIAAPARAESARSLNRDGIAAFRDGDYETARDLFAQAREKDAESLLLEYNQGAALARNGELDQAISAFSKATEARDEAVSAGAKYSLSAAACEMACRMAEEGDAENALKMLETAVRSGRDALLADPTDDDARMNYEIARRLQKQLEQQQQKQEQQQDEKKGDEEKDDENKDDQQKQNEEGEDQEDKKQQNDEQQQDQENEQQQNQDEQEEKQSEQQEKEQQDEQQSDEQKEEPQESEAGNAEESEEPSPEEKDATLNALNLLDDNDVEALKRMLQRRYGRTQTPDKDW